MKVLRKIISSILLLLVVCGTLTAVACKEEKTGFSLDNTAITLYVFEDKTLTLTSGSNKSVVWTATNDEVITLTPNGKSVTVTGVKSGETTVIATQGNNSVSCKVTVFPARTTLTVTINSLKSVQKSIGETYQIETTVKLNGEAFNDATLEYSIVNASPNGCVTVDGNGLITAVSQGTAIVSVRAKYGNDYSEYANITVYVFSSDYDNDAEKQPETEEGGSIDDVFGGW